MSEGSSPQSMEAILASIKRVIADSPARGQSDPDAPEPTPRARPDAPARWAPDDDVLELGGTMALDAAPEPQTAPPAALDALVSTATHAASVRAIAALSAVTIDPAAADHTLDGLVRELLRPMLKDWLDANLPDLVERVVAREVARLGGR